MGGHRGACHLRIAPLHGIQDAFVMNLAALRSAFHVEDLYALLTQ
jgi:hypothetical protein